MSPKIRGNIFYQLLPCFHFMHIYTNTSSDAKYFVCITFLFCLHQCVILSHYIWSSQPCQHIHAFPTFQQLSFNKPHLLSHGIKATLSKLCEIKHPLVTELPDFRVSLDPRWVSLDPCSALSTVVSSADGDGSLVKSSDGMDFLQHTELHQMWRNKVNTLSLKT